MRLSSLSDRQRLALELIDRVRSEKQTQRSTATSAAANSQSNDSGTTDKVSDASAAARLQRKA